MAQRYLFWRWRYSWMRLWHPKMVNWPCWCVCLSTPPGETILDLLLLLLTGKVSEFPLFFWYFLVVPGHRIKTLYVIYDRYEYFQLPLVINSGKDEHVQNEKSTANCYRDAQSSWILRKRFSTRRIISGIKDVFTEKATNATSSPSVVQKWWESVIKQRMIALKSWNVMYVKLIHKSSPVDNIADTVEPACKVSVLSNEDWPYKWADHTSEQSQTPFARLPVDGIGRNFVRL